MEMMVGVAVPDEVVIADNPRGCNAAGVPRGDGNQVGKSTASRLEGEQGVMRTPPWEEANRAGPSATRSATDMMTGNQGIGKEAVHNMELRVGVIGVERIIDEAGKVTEVWVGIMGLDRVRGGANKRPILREKGKGLERGTRGRMGKEMPGALKELEVEGVRQATGFRGREMDQGSVNGTEEDATATSSWNGS
jgi:hypothetical protein